MVVGMRATISGRVGGGRMRSTEVSGETYDRYRQLKTLMGFNGDQMAELATDGGRQVLSERAVVHLLDLMEVSMREAGAFIGGVGARGRVKTRC